MAEEKTCVFQFLTVTVFSDGSVSRAPYDPPLVPASPLGEGAPALTKDLTLNAGTGTWIRLFLPHPPPAVTNSPEGSELTTTQQKRKLPILLYFHGGGFVQGSTAVPIDHRFLCTLASRASILIVSVDYRLAPEHRLPCAYEDCTEALLWLCEQAKASREGEEGLADPWLTSHGDFSRVFLAGDSAGANIAHHVAVRAASAELGLKEGGLCVRGCIPIHPFFGSEVLSDFESQNPVFVNIVRKLWKHALPDEEGSSMDHPYANPLASPSFLEDIAGLPPVLVAIAGADNLRDRGTAYVDALQKAGKQVKLLMSPDEPHVFHLHNPAAQNFPAFVEALAAFINS